MILLQGDSARDGSWQLAVGGGRLPVLAGWRTGQVGNGNIGQVANMEIPQLADAFQCSLPYTGSG
jgi:hypothetical protein